jgi:hypothetical protein
MSGRRWVNAFAVVVLPLLVLLPVGLLAAVAVATQQGAACAEVAAPDGSDSAAGTVGEPFLTAQRLVDSLGPGETGCLRAGRYEGGFEVKQPGTAGEPITITSYPGERATVAGRLWVKDSADFITVSSLDLDGRNARNLPSPAINGDDVGFVDNDVTNANTTICFSLGATIYGRAERTLIERNRIHRCGELPPTNLDHGIYVEHATDARIVDNVIVDNADRGVQLYPDAQDTYVARNVIDGNGEGVLIGGGAEELGPQASSGNVVEQNLITNSRQRYNVESHWDGGLLGVGNVVRRNCIYGGARHFDRHGLAPDRGFSSSGNVLADPLYEDRAAGDYRVRPDSPCRGLALAADPSVSESGPDPPAREAGEAPASAFAGRTSPSGRTGSARSRKGPLGLHGARHELRPRSRPARERRELGITRSGGASLAAVIAATRR